MDSLTVFCQYCGKKQTSGANYCFHCGKRLCSGSGLSCKDDNTTKPKNSKESESSLNEQIHSKGISFESFRKRKEAARASKFISKKGKNNIGEVTVKIQVGFKRENNGELKKVKGQTLPIQVKETSTINELLSASIDKHAKHFKQFNRFEDYCLLYPDDSIMNYMPGTLDPFVLNMYKNDIGKPYSKIMFWLCKISDMEKVTDENSTHDSSMSDPEPSGTCGSLYLAKQEKQEVTCQDSTKSTYTQSQSSSQENSTAFIVPCPTCSFKFPLNEIEEHANLCIDEIIGTISDDADDNGDDNHIDDCEDECYITDEKPEAKDEKDHDPCDGQLKKCVENLQKQVETTTHTRVNIRRRFVLKDYLDLRKRKWFKPNKMFKVTFIGEPAIDDGGPRREFFSEVLKQIKQQLFRDGFLLYNMGSLSNSEFHAVGELFAASIVQGGPAPCFLAEELYDYIASPDSMKTIMKDIPRWASKVQDERVTMIIYKLSKCTTDEQFQQTMTEDEVLTFLSGIGYRGIPFKETLDQREAIIRSLILSDICKMLPLMDQLVKGLESFGVLHAIRENCHSLRALFTSTGESSQYLPTSEDFLNSVDAEFSENGSNRKEKEISVYKFFTDYIQELSVAEADDTSLSHLHRFITGMEEIPPLGLPNRITVKFKHTCSVNCSCRPTVSTCDLSLTFPVHYEDFASFQESINSAINDCCGFGLL